MNIIWKKLNSGVAFTSLTPEALEKIALARSYLPLVERRADIQVARDDADARLQPIREAIKTARDELANAIKAVRAPNDMDEEQAKRAINAQIAALIAQCEDLITPLNAQAEPLTQLLQEAETNLRCIAFHDEIKASIGLDSYEHYLVLLSRAQGQAAHDLASGRQRRQEVIDWQCVAHDIEVPATRRYREAWRWTTPDPIIDIDQDEARRCVMREVRARRNADLAALDEPQQQAKDAGDTAAFDAIEAQKQALRDLPVDAADAVNDCVNLAELDRVTFDQIKQKP